MFDSKHYIPILKWKRAEQGALKALRGDQKEHITPLIQFVMKYEPGEQLEDIINKFKKEAKQIPEKLVEIWGRTPIFIDVSLLFTTPLKVKSIKNISLGGHRLKGTFIPVFHLSDNQEIKDVTYWVAKETGSGLCLRLVCPDFDNPVKLNQDIADMLSSSKLAEGDIDLLVDIKETGGDDDKCIKYLKLSQNIPNLTKWRTFTFAGGSFPKDLSQCKPYKENLVQRVGWKNWKEYRKCKELRRKPSFADYTIQYPIYREVSQFFHPTTSIKYTLEDYWLIMKGQRQKFDKYLASAALLVEDKRYYGEDFSDGDKYIAERARHFPFYMRDPSLKGTGSTETWLRAGINHHLSLAARQVANLS